MRDAVIVGAVRKPLGRRGGVRRNVPAELSAQVLNALMRRTGVDCALADDVLWGCVSQVGEQAANIGRRSTASAGPRSRRRISPWPP
jgi:acetyl-CoA acyltransferase